jgi:hypothetical protein
LLDRIDSRELTEWEAYERVEGPVGIGRQDHLFAALMAVIANGNRGRGQRAYTASDFMPKWETKAGAQEMDGDAMLRAIKGINKAMGGGTGSGDAR